MNTIAQVMILVLITLAIIFAVVMKSPMVALAGLLITAGSVVWFKEPATKGVRHAYTR